MATLEVLQVLKGIMIHYCKGDNLWGSKGQRLYKSEDGGQSWSLAGKIEGSLKSRICGGSKLLSRLFRCGVHNLVSLGSGTLLAISEGKVYRCNPGGTVFKAVYSLMHGRRPLPQALTEDADGNLYYGEYWPNEKREPVHIVRSIDQGNTWQPVYTFPKGSVRHIHALQFDKYQDKLWVATGDEDSECVIAFSEDKGASFTKIGEGSQVWRAVSLVFTRDYVYWGTDDPKGHNHIYKWDRKTGILAKVGPVKGPVYYSRKVGKHLLFSAVVECGGGDQDGYARIYELTADSNIHEVFKLKKDRWHPILFGYGIFEFARGDTDEGPFWVSTIGLLGGKSSLLLRFREGN